MGHVEVNMPNEELGISFSSIDSMASFLVVE